MGLTKPCRPRVPPLGRPRSHRQLCDPGQGWAASQGGSGWRTHSRPSRLTSRRVLLRLPLVTWKFSWGYNFCRFNLEKTRPALTASSHNRTWQDTRTTQNRHLGRWAPGTSREGSWIVLSRQAVPCVEQDRASLPLVRLHRDLPEMLVTSQYHQARRCHKLDSKAWELFRSPLSPRPHLTPSRCFKNPQITGRRSLGGGGRKVKANTCSCHRWKFIHRSALSGHWSLLQGVSSPSKLRRPVLQSQ